MNGLNKSHSILFFAQTNDLKCKLIFLKFFYPLSLVGFIPECSVLHTLHGVLPRTYLASKNIESFKENKDYKAHNICQTINHDVQLWDCLTENFTESWNFSFLQSLFWSAASKLLSPCLHGSRTHKSQTGKCM